MANIMKLMGLCSPMTPNVPEPSPVVEQPPSSCINMGSIILPVIAISLVVALLYVKLSSWMTSEYEEILHHFKGITQQWHKPLKERREAVAQRVPSPARVPALPQTYQDTVTYFPRPLSTGDVLMALNPAVSLGRRLSRPCPPAPTKLRGRPRRQAMHRLQEVPESPGEMQTEGEAVVLQLIPRSGDSLFAALACQLMGAAVGSDTHARDTATLRRTAGHQLVGSMGDYRALLLRSIAVHGDRYLMLQTDDERIHRYLSDLLSPGHPGGLECLQAVADASHAHVAVYPEGSARYVVRSRDAAASRKVAVAQRAFRARDDMPMPHYDSVTRSRPL